MIVLAFSTTTSAQPADTSVKAVLAAADAYLLDYQKQLTFLIADEHTTQEAGWRGAAMERRRTRGDLFVTFVPADRAWVAVHDVAFVDEVPVEGHEEIERLLQRNTVAGVARQLVMRNARFNIGKVQRNFNEPTLGLLVLDPRRRSQVKFERARAAPNGDPGMVTITFRETERPTLVQADGRAVYATGELLIQAGTGRIRRTFIRLAYGSLTAELTTVYTRDPKLDLWLPSTFTERYEHQQGRTAVGLPSINATRCVSTYTNWRKFSAAGSFKPVIAP